MEPSALLIDLQGFSNALPKSFWDGKQNQAK